MRHFVRHVARLVVMLLIAKGGQQISYLLCNIILEVNFLLALVVVKIKSSFFH